MSKVKIVGPVLEPAAGVGHMVRELRRGHGLEVIASDLHAYEDPLIPDIEIQDIWAIDSLEGFKFVITNLPYQEQDELAAHLVTLGVRDGCSLEGRFAAIDPLSDRRRMVRSGLISAL